MSATHNNNYIHERSSSHARSSSDILEEVNLVNVKRSSIHHHYGLCSRFGFQHVSRKCPTHGKTCSRYGGKIILLRYALKKNEMNVARYDDDGHDVHLNIMWTIILKLINFTKGDVILSAIFG